MFLAASASPIRTLKNRRWYERRWTGDVELSHFQLPVQDDAHGSGPERKRAYGRLSSSRVIGLTGMERPFFLLLPHKLLLCPLLLSLLLSLILPWLLHLLTNESLFLQKLTFRSYSRRPTAVFGMASDPRQLVAAALGKPMQSSEWPPTEKIAHLLSFWPTNTSATSPTSRSARR